MKITVLWYVVPCSSVDRYAVNTDMATILIVLGNLKSIFPDNKDQTSDFK